MQVCFFFNAQRHQLLHGIATAVHLSRTPGIEVYVVSPAQSHVDYAKAIAERIGGSSIIFVHARSWLLARAMEHSGSVIPPKILSLILLSRWLNTFDAICLPERTSTVLRWLGATRPLFIHLDHGAGDRAAGFDKRIRNFDFVLMAGTKHRERLMSERLITPGNHAVVGYPKFEAADAIRADDWYPFAERRPVVLYNPHFSKLGSWETCAEPLLAAFAGQDRYNLLLAPHVRLLDSHAARNRWGAMLARYANLPHIHIDVGSDRAIDMTYTTMADIYLGDVSSQIYEFLRTPRPCLFINPHGVEWAGDENYAHWRFGPVLDDTAGIIEAVDRAILQHPEFAQAQVQGMASTFAAQGGAACAARAITDYLHRQSPSPLRSPSRRGEAKPHLAPLMRKLATLMLLLAGGWVLGEATEATVRHVESAPSAKQAAASRHAARPDQGGKALAKRPVRKV